MSKKDKKRRMSTFGVPATQQKNYQYKVQGNLTSSSYRSQKR